MTNEVKYTKYDRMGLEKMAHSMNELKQEIDQLADQKTRLQKEYDYLRFIRLPAKMEERGMEKFHLKDVGLFYTQDDVTASTKAGMKEKAFEWLDDHDLGSLITETINASTLKSLAKRRLLAGEPLPEDLFNVTPITRVVIKRN